MNTRVKEENLQHLTTADNGNKTSVIEISSSDDDDETSECNSYPDETADVESSVDLSPHVSKTFSAVGVKRARSDSKDTPSKRLASDEGLGFGQSIPPTGQEAILAIPCNVVRPASSSCKQFWKAGDYEGTSGSGGAWEVSAGGFDHVRVHPKFLHSNATSHKWALGAFAELLDNALDEVHSGATFVNVNMLNNRKDGSKMVLIEDDGGGMTPEKMRHCMSLGYSAKSKLANTIGQYGNGFKTSTMRLGADVIVFSRCRGNDGDSFTQSIGLLSYTFLKCTGKEDIVVPMLDYERIGSEWSPILRSSVSDWNKNVETVAQWSPFSTEDDLLRQFNLMKDHGTRIIIYNLWEDDQGQLELDFDTDPHDIQLRGVNRDEKSINMATQFPNSRHFLTYKHSLRSYASILYLRFPHEFRIILRGRDVEHHNIVNDMMHTDQITYRPKDAPDGLSNSSNMSAVVTIGFVKDAEHHVDVQGFNVYHKNRLIKPFWRLWNAAGSDGRGVIGVLEANFVEPAHDKQELSQIVKLGYFIELFAPMLLLLRRSKCHKIGYASRQGKKSAKDSEDRESTPDYYDPKGSVSTRKRAATSSFKSKTAASRFKSPPTSNVNGGGKGSVKDSTGKGGELVNTSFKSNERAKRQGTGSDGVDDDDSSTEKIIIELPERSTEVPKPCSSSRTLSQLEQENEELKERLGKNEDAYLLLQDELRHEKELRKKLEAEVQKRKDEIEKVKKEQESLINLFSEDRDRHDKEEDDLRNKLEEASNKIKTLLDEKSRGRR
ncbi:hypothetical protein Bca101_026919 [Brassica carinata]